MQFYNRYKFGIGPRFSGVNCHAEIFFLIACKARVLIELEGIQIIQRSTYIYFVIINPAPFSNWWDVFVPKFTKNEKAKFESEVSGDVEAIANPKN